MVLRRLRLPPRRQPAPAVVGRAASPGGATPTLKLSAAPFTDHRAFVAYHYENNDGNGWSWGSLPGWDTFDDLRLQDDEQHRLRAVAVVQRPQDDRLRQVAGLLDGRHALHSRGRSRPSRATSTGGSGPTPTAATASTAPSPTSRPTSRAATPSRATSRTMPRASWASTTSSSASSTRRGGATPRAATSRTTSTSSTRTAGRRASSTCSPGTATPGLLFYNQKDTINPSLTVRTGDSMGVFFDDQWTPTRRLTINLGLRFDHMSAKYGVGKVYDFPSSPDGFNDPTVLRDRASTDNVFDFKTWSPRVGAELPADGGRQDRRAGLVRPLLHAAHRRVPPPVRPRHAPGRAGPIQMYEVGPWSSGRHERRRDRSTRTRRSRRPEWSTG